MYFCKPPNAASPLCRRIPTFCLVCMKEGGQFTRDTFTKYLYMRKVVLSEAALFPEMPAGPEGGRSGAAKAFLGSVVVQREEFDDLEVIPAHR